MKTFVYEVNDPGDCSAGIAPIAETIHITIQSGDPGGEINGPWSFQENMREAIAEWYDTPNVKLIQIK